MFAIILVLIVVVAIFMLVNSLMNLTTSAKREAEDTVKRRLESLNMSRANKRVIQNIVLNESLSEVPWMNRLLSRLAFARKLNHRLKQAKVKVPASVIIMTSLLLFVITFYVTGMFADTFIYQLALSLIIGYLPFAWLKRRMNKRIFRFEQQLPDALDLIARALQAGHAFSGGLRMIADEFDEPIGPEFEQTLDEINFGLSTSEALENLCKRVDSLDLRFFVVSVNIQHETGGNLSEIVTAISSLIRDRAKLKGRIKVLSAEGRLSAWVLMALPLVIAGLIYFINPGYMSLLFEHPVGRIVAGSAVVQMIVGMFIIKRMVKIQV